MKKLLFACLSLFLFQLASNANVDIVDKTDSPVKSVYQCQYRNETCTLYKAVYKLMNKTTYEAVCTGSAGIQKQNRNKSIIDVRNNRYRYCTLKSSEQ